MDSGRSDEKVVPVSLFEEICAHARARQPASNRPTASSITYDQNILVFDNGQNSLFQNPPGAHRIYASPRKYKLDLAAKIATEVWNYEIDQSIHCPF